jgi:uncharacterized oligopeptide transporter (OPT) family protein
MSLFQKPPTTPEEIARSRPLEIPPDQVMTFDEATWYARAFRGEDAPQLTVRAVVVGTILGFFLSFTNIYIGLKTGWFVGVAITSSILSYSVWTTMMKLGIVKTPMSILETNCMQSTASSAGYATGHALVTAVPAMLLLTVNPAMPGGTQIPWQILAPWVFCLAILGVFLAIPMKRNMINQERLTFPSGTAAAVTLQSLYGEGREALVRGRALFGSMGLAMLVPLVKDLEILKKVDPTTHKVAREALLPSTTNIFDWLPGIHAAGKVYKWSDFTMKLDNSIVLMGAGAIVGLRVTLSMLVGGLFLAFVIAPHALSAEWINPAGKLVTAATKPSAAWKEIGIWVGAPIMVSSGLVAFAAQWRTIVRAFSSLRGGGSDDALVKRTEVPLSWFAAGAAVGGVGVVLLAWRFFEVPPHYGVIAVLLTFVLALVACRATGETDITPGGPMGKIMQLTYGVLIPQSTTANLMTAGITSNAALASADLLNDLKSGYLLGAHPRRQFVAQFLGIFTGTIASTLGYFILIPNAQAITGIDGGDPKFACPGALQWKAVAEVFKLGLENLHPMARAGIFWGLAIGVVLALLEAIFPRWKKYLPSPTGIGIGLLLPFFYPLAFFLGAVIAEIYGMLDEKNANRFVVPIASGIIAGESIMGVIVAALNNFVLN